LVKKTGYIYHMEKKCKLFCLWFFHWNFTYSNEIKDCIYFLF